MMEVFKQYRKSLNHNQLYETKRSLMSISGRFGKYLGLKITVIIKKQSLPSEPKSCPFEMIQGIGSGQGLREASPAE